MLENVARRGGRVGQVQAAGGSEGDCDQNKCSACYEERDRERAPLTVFGPDDRTKVTDPTVSPYVQMPIIFFTEPDGGHLCTGWLYDNRTIGTAAHCLTDGQGNRYSLYSVYFGLDGDTASAQCGYNVLAAPAVYDGTPGSDYDWGILVLNCYAGNVLGHLGYKVQSNAPSDDYSLTGYPGDKWTDADGYTMWTDSGWVLDYNTYRWYYEIDANPGESGSALWRLEAGTACGNCVIGTNTTQSSLFNSGTRITSTVWNALTAYKTTYP